MSSTEQPRQPPSSTTASSNSSSSTESKMIELVAQCLCKAHAFSTLVPTPPASDSPLPLGAIYCHCDSCRHNTGCMYAGSVVWPSSFSSAPPPPPHGQTSGGSSFSTNTGNGGDNSNSLSHHSTAQGELQKEEREERGRGQQEEEQKEFEQKIAKLKRYNRSKDATGLFCENCGSPLFYEAVLPSPGPSPSPDAGMGGEQLGKKDQQQVISGQDTHAKEEKQKEVRKVYGTFLGVLRGYHLDNGGKRMGPVTKGLVRPAHHLFVGDTIDGGATCWMNFENPEENGQKAKRWVGHRGISEEITGDFPPAFPLPLAGAGASAVIDTDRKAYIQCHCAGVNLTYNAGQAQKEFLDLIEKGEEEEGKVPWFVDRQTGKSAGSLDGCNSCTISSGADFFGWTFALLKHLSYSPESSTSTFSESSSAQSKRCDISGNKEEGQEAVAEFPKDSNALRAAVLDKKTKPNHGLGTLEMYESSPDVQRYFCGRCSASVFYCVDDRPEMVDIALGLLSLDPSPSLSLPVSSSGEETGAGDKDKEKEHNGQHKGGGGARVESIISWSRANKIGWREDVLGTWREEFLGSIEGKLQSWKHKRSE